MIQSERLANARLQHQKQQAALATTTRSRSKPSHDRASAAQNKAHQPLSCIIDDSALLAGLQEKGGLKQWVRNGAINLFVPLYSMLNYQYSRGQFTDTFYSTRKARQSTHQFPAIKQRCPPCAPMAR